MPRFTATLQCFATVLPLAALHGCGTGDTAQATAVVLPVQTVAVSAASTAGAAGTRYPAIVVRDREANLAFRVPGVIDEMAVQIGQQVRQGQILARLADTTYAAARTRAEADAARVQRSVQRNGTLLSTGAVSQRDSEDSVSALTAAQAAAEAARYDEQSAILRAPFDGIVLSRDAEVGEAVGPAQRILRIADRSSAVLARVAVPFNTAVRLRAGLGSKLMLGSEDGVRDARIVRIGALSDPRTASVTVDLRIADGGDLPSGAVGSVSFELPHQGKADEVLRLPPEALLSAEGGVGAVFVLDPNGSVARRTPIRLLGFDGEWLRIADLPLDAHVITAGAGFVVDGQPVREVRP